MKKIKLFFRKVLSIFKYGKRIRPTRDWLVLIAIFMIALCASIGWNVWLFSQVTKGQKIGSVAASTPVQIRLDQVKELFTKRATERDNYLNKYRFVDPLR